MESFSKDGTAVFVSEDNPLPVSATVNATIDPGDVEIGAVEIKDGTADTRAAVLTTVPGASDPGLVTRVAGSVTISDGSGPVTVDGTVEIVNDVGNAIPVNGTVEVTNDVGNPLPVSGSVTNTEARPSTAVITSVAGSVSTGVLKASNANRLGLTVHNDSTANLYLAFAATATTSAFTVKIAAGGYYELPRPVYTGAVSGIWDAANGNARVTEVTA